MGKLGNLNNLRLLKNDMKSKQWSICDFLFRYKGIEYIVLVKRFVETKKVNGYALVKLEFMKSDNIDDSLQVEANSYRLLIDAKTLRSYFGIEYAYNLGDILEQFSQRLGSSIPTKLPDMKKINDLEKKAMISSLSKSDSEDPNKIYCTGVKRNPEGQKRSEFNSDKTKLLRENLYNSFADDTSISFCYSTDISKEKDDVTILKNFANK